MPSAYSSDEDTSGKGLCTIDVNMDAFESDDEEPKQARVNSRSNMKQEQRKIESSSAASAGRSASEGKRVVVQTLAGPQYKRESSAVVEKAAAQEMWNTIEVQYALTASLKELADGTKEPVLKVADHVDNVFGEKAGAGRSKNHICGGMSIVDVGSSFPVTLQLDIEGLKTALPAKSITDTGSAATFTIRPKMSFSHPVGKEIYAGNKAAAENSPFLQEYKDYTLDNVDSGINYVEDEDGEHALIRKTHPVIGLFNDARRQIGKGPLTDDDLLEKTQLYIASASDTRKCLGLLKGLMQEKLQIQNLYDVKFNLRRARGGASADSNDTAWDSLQEIGDSVKGDQSKARLLSQPNQLHVTVQYKYKSLGRGS